MLISYGNLDIQLIQMSLYNIILMVDDDQEDQELFVDALKEIDPSIYCVTANDGDDAQELLSSMIIKPDLIFIDINMPKYNGKELLTILKSSSETAGIPVVMYSTHFNADDLSEMKSIGAAHFVTKKTSYSQLCDILQSTISVHWQ